MGGLPGWYQVCSVKKKEKQTTDLNYDIKMLKLVLK